MGGVDISNQKTEYYGVGRSSKKWWKFIFHVCKQFYTLRPQ
jgi:hypothetical protein